MESTLPKTIEELKSSNYVSRSVKDEIRHNLINKLSKGEKVFPGIHGFEKTVIPQIQTAILSGQDMILLGERGQAKSKIIREIVNLLDPLIPVIENCDINDHPLNPICKRCKELVKSDVGKTGISWLAREDRFSEKLATPDVSVSDMIGDIDPIKITEGRYLGDELAIHYGMIPRANRGIFCINEIPDLTERIQVSLFNIMQERDVQIKGYQLRLPIDIFLVSTANPEDYTNRGRIITPLKDRYGAQIRTHYPTNVEEELIIVKQEYKKFADSEERVSVPDFMARIVGEITHLARNNPEINHRSGVSRRVTIANYESMISSAFMRSITSGEKTHVNMRDLKGLIPSTVGKIEGESVEENQEVRIIEEVINRAVLNVFTDMFSTERLDDTLKAFESGTSINVGNSITESEFLQACRSIPSLVEICQNAVGASNPGTLASIIELVLEGLYLSGKISKSNNIYS